MTASGSWEDPIVENPAMLVDGGTYYLLYAGNRWRTADYAVGLASCKTPSGPCTKLSTKKPWFGSDPTTTLRGPGGADFVRVRGGAADRAPDGSFTMTMHGWIAPKVGPPAGTRALWLAEMRTGGSGLTAALLR